MALTIMLDGVEYEVKKITNKQLEELENLIKSNRLAVLNNTDIDPFEKRELRKDILKSEIPYSELFAKFDTASGLRWLLSKSVYKDGEAISDASLDSLLALDRFNQTADEIMDFVLGVRENPTEPEEGDRSPESDSMPSSPNSMDGAIETSSDLP